MPLILRSVFDLSFRHREDKSLFSRFEGRYFMRQNSMVHKAIISDPSVNVIRLKKFAPLVN